MALRKANYGLKKLNGGKGYSVRPWVTNPYTGKKEQVFKQSKRWSKAEALRYVVELIENPKTYFKPLVNSSHQSSSYNMSQRLSMKNTIDDLYQAYYQYAETKYSPASRRNTRLNYSKHIKPMLGNIMLEEVDKVLISDWIQSLFNYKKESGNFSSNAEVKTMLRNSSIVNIVSVLKNMFKFGNEEKNLSLKTPIKYKLNSYETKYEAPYLEDDDRINFFECVAEENITRDMALFSFLLVTGARRGEALALQPEMIDFELKKVSIKSNLSLGRMVGPTKTHNVRKIKLNEDTLDLLKKRIKELEMMEGYDKKKAFVFGDIKPMSFSTLDRLRKKYIEKAHKKYPHISTAITNHGFRHSAAKVLADEHGIDKAQVYLGHKSIHTTAIYASQEPDESMADTLSLTKNRNSRKKRKTK